MGEPKQHLPTYEGCVICGRKEVNPNALGLRFKVVDGGVEVRYTPDANQEGFKGIVHGGVLCALLDETIGWAVAVDRQRYFVTGELSVRFLQPLKVGTGVIVKGRALERKFRYSTAEGEVVDASGTTYARATGKFFVMPEDQERIVRNYLTVREDDVDFLNRPGSREAE